MNVSRCKIPILAQPILAQCQFCLKTRSSLAESVEPELVFYVGDTVNVPSSPVNRLTLAEGRLTLTELNALTKNV